MAKQSRETVILLTRPLAQSLRFQREVRHALGLVPIVISPLMAPQYLTPPIPPHPYTAVIFASITAVDAAQRISAIGVALPKLAYCVGDRTAMTARAAGFEARSAMGDAVDLVAMIIAENPIGPLLFLRGQDSRGDIRENLISAGIDTVSSVIYDQTAQPLSDEAVKILMGRDPVTVPLFSPRSARMFQSELARLGLIPQLWIAALSPAVAAELDVQTIARMQISQSPDSVSMILALQAVMSSGAAP